MSSLSAHAPRSRRTGMSVVAALFMGLLTSIGVAWGLALTATFEEVADPHAQARTSFPATYTMYSVRSGVPQSPPTRKERQGDRGGLAESVTDESIRDAAAYFGGLETSHRDEDSPYPIDRRFFSHRVFRSRAASRAILVRFHFDAGMSWEFFSVKPAALAPPDSVALFKRSFPSPAWPPAFGKEMVIMDQYGWPSDALGGSLRVTKSDLRGTRVIDERWAIALSERSAAAQTGALRTPTLHETARFLPLRPMPGLLVNTVFWGAVWGVLLFVPGQIRRQARLRCGLCPHCAYDLRATPATAPCPECGTLSVR